MKFQIFIFFTIDKILPINVKKKAKYNKSIVSNRSNLKYEKNYIDSYFFIINVIMKDFACKKCDQSDNINKKLKEKGILHIECIYALLKNSLFKIKFKQRIYILKRCQIKKNEVNKEIKIIKNLKHKNILEVFNTYQQDFYINDGFYSPYKVNWILSNFYEKINIDLFIKNLEIIQKFSIDILTGLQYIHNKGIAHLDIKPDNIMVEKDGKKLYKIIGFDRSVLIKNLERPKKNIYGTMFYYAPEIHNIENFNCKSDIWSLGMTLYYLYLNVKKIPTKKDIFLETEYLNFLQSNEKIELLEKYDTDFADFIYSSTIQDWKKRPSACKLLEHPFLKKIYQ